MRGALLVIAVTLAALGLTSAVVVWGGDSTLLVPPPESVAEQFVKQVAARRYDRALQYVDGDAHMSLATVRGAAEELRERVGAINSVEGRPGSITSERTSAAAVLSTEYAGEVTETFTMVRRNGLWKIVK